ncbi:hypothetical protein L7F22_015022 [Adiantum nelumboides]|nr:hypothetical protein [Adiantum nelumboides]
MRTVITARRGSPGAAGDAHDTSCWSDGRRPVDVRSPARHRARPGDGAGCRDVPGRRGSGGRGTSRGGAPAVAGPRGHLRRGHPARARDPRLRRRRRRLRPRARRVGHELDRPRRAPRTTGGRPVRRPARVRAVRADRRRRLRPGRHGGRAAVLAGRARPPGAPGRQLPRRRDRDDGGGPPSRARPQPHPGLARGAGPASRPATPVGPADGAGHGAAARARRAAGAGRGAAAGPRRADREGLLRRSGARLRPAARGADLRTRAPRDAALGRRGHRRRHPRSARAVGRARDLAPDGPGAGAVAGGVGRAGPHRVPAACRADRGHTARGAAAGAAPGRARRADRAARGGGRRRRRAVGHGAGRSGSGRDGATATGGAGRRAHQGRGRAVQPPPDHPRRRDGRAEAPEEREGAGRRRGRPRLARPALPGRRRRRHPGHRRVRRGRRVEPAAPGHPRPVRRGPAEGRVGPRLDPRGQPLRRRPPAQRAPHQRERAGRLPRLRPDPGRHRQLRHPLPGQRRGGAARQALRLGLDLPFRGPGVGLLGGRPERAGPQLPRPLPRAAAARDGPLLRRGRRARRALRVDRLDHGQRGDQAAHRHRRAAARPSGDLRRAGDHLAPGEDPQGPGDAEDHRADRLRGVLRHRDAAAAAAGSTITANELKEMMDAGKDFQLVDVREPHEYEIVKIPGSVLIPKDRILSGAALSEIPQDKPVVLHCKSGGRSAEALAALHKAGFNDAVHVGGGVLSWVKQIDPSQPTY